MKRLPLIDRRLVRAAVCFTVLGGAALAHAQKADETSAPKPAPSEHRYESTDPMRTFNLKTGSAPNDANEILTALRLLTDPSTKLYLVPSTNQVIVRGTPGNILVAEKVLAEIDRPKKVYKLTYTITESDGGKRIGLQRFTTVQVSGARTTLKNGSKVPVATGSYTAGSGSQMQFTYLDVGLNFDSTIDEAASGLRLRSKIEQSSAAEEKVLNDVHEPIIRQTVLEGTSIVTVGQPLMLGSLDIAGSTRHLDIEAVLELAK